eukprot:TRINITY_DN1012_c0_g1_i1.p1 TRINITY_DN1012_c0_g1~~TRINITY_DN1012_c0_g1_i1.p1  ORF type:complete len:467 (-),score=137.14 TRINITY_DN1012_c0_g1_i1:59-1369(-)
MAVMRTAFSLLFAPLALADSTGAQVAQLPASQAEVSAQQAKLANDMGNYYRSMYAPGVPAVSNPAAGASQAEVQAQQAKVADQMGKFYRSQYAPAGTPAYGASSSGAQTAADMGKFYRSQYAPPGIEAQVAAQQAQQKATADAAPQAQQKATADAAPQALLAEAATTTSKPIPATAEDCKTMDELDAWYKARKDTVMKYVPKDYNHFALDSLKREYTTNAARIRGESKAPAPAPAPAEALSTEDTTGPLALEARMNTDKKASVSAQDMSDWQRKVAEAMKKAQEKTNGAMDKASSSVDKAADAWKQQVDKASETVQQKANDAADKVDKASETVQQKANDAADKAAGSFGDFADRFKHRFDAAADRVKKAADGVPEKAGESPEVLSASAPSSAVLQKATRASAVLVVLSSGAFVGLWLRRRAQASQEELMSVYHMQP